MAKKKVSTREHIYVTPVLVGQIEASEGIRKRIEHVTKAIDKKKSKIQTMLEMKESDGDEQEKFRVIMNEIDKHVISIEELREEMKNLKKERDLQIKNYYRDIKKHDTAKRMTQISVATTFIFITILWRNRDVCIAFYLDYVKPSIQRKVELWK